jgi:hypothetical protein
MESPTEMLVSLFERIEIYVRTTFELSKLKLLHTTTIIVTALIARMSVIIMFALFALIMNIGVALFLGELLGKLYYGFFIVAAFYLLAALILHFFMYKWIKKPISDLIIKQALQ